MRNTLSLLTIVASLILFSKGVNLAQEPRPVKKLSDDPAGAAEPPTESRQEPSGASQEAKVLRQRVLSLTGLPPTPQQFRQLQNQLAEQRKKSELLVKEAQVIADERARLQGELQRLKSQLAIMDRLKTLDAVDGKAANLAHDEGLRDLLTANFTELAAAEEALTATLNVYNQLPAAGKYWIGVQTVKIPATVRPHLDLPEGRGVLVSSIVANSAAADAGLRENDVIYGYGEREIDDIGTLSEAVQEVGLTGTTIQLLRAGKRLELKIQARQRPQINEAPVDELSVQFSRQGTGPPQLTVRRGEETWKADSYEALKQIPADVLALVRERLSLLPASDAPTAARYWLSKAPEGIVRGRWVAPPQMPVGKPISVVTPSLLQRLEALQQRVKALEQKQQ